MSTPTIVPSAFVLGPHVPFVSLAGTRFIKYCQTNNHLRIKAMRINGPLIKNMGPACNYYFTCYSIFSREVEFYFLKLTRHRSRVQNSFTNLQRLRP